jgi:serine/threonine protein kinase
MPATFKPDQTRYELEQKLGEGLNCVVWRATRYDFSGENRRTVALKLPKDKTSVPFLRREFDVLQRLNSNHCARVIAWESCGDQLAMALEWIDGVTLLEFAQSRLVDITDEMSQEIIRQIYVGLQDLKAAGVFHGDLQPSNIMVDREGHVRLIDFASGQLSDGCVQATPAFVSPEVWSGAPLSYESDLFSLKVIRDHLKDGFRHLPPRPGSSSDLKIAKSNEVLKAKIGSKVSSLLARSSMSGTEIISPAESSAIESGRRPKLLRIALALSLILAATLPVRAEAPAESAQKKASVSVRSQSWMQIWVNGAPAGFAPLDINHLKPGIHRLTWESARGKGEIRLRLNEGDSTRLIESGQRPGQLEVR